MELWSDTFCVTRKKTLEWNRGSIFLIGFNCSFHVNMFCLGFLIIFGGTIKNNNRGIMDRGIKVTNHVLLLRIFKKLLLQKYIFFFLPLLISFLQQVFEKLPTSPITWSKKRCSEGGRDKYRVSNLIPGRAWVPLSNSWVC